MRNGKKLIFPKHTKEDDLLDVKRFNFFDLIDKEIVKHLGVLLLFKECYTKKKEKEEKEGEEEKERERERKKRGQFD